MWKRRLLAASAAAHVMQAIREGSSTRQVRGPLSDDGARRRGSVWNQTTAKCDRKRMRDPRLDLDVQLQRATNAANPKTTKQVRCDMRYAIQMEVCVFCLMFLDAMPGYRLAT